MEFTPTNTLPFVITMNVRAEETSTDSSVKTKSVSKTFALKGSEQSYVESILETLL